MVPAEQRRVYEAFIVTAVPGVGEFRHLVATVGWLGGRFGVSWPFAEI
jgi:hypothetical protein